MIAHNVSWRVPEARTPLDIDLPASDRIVNMAQVEASCLLFHSCEKCAHGEPDYSFYFANECHISGIRLIGVKEARHGGDVTLICKEERVVRLAMSALQL